MKAKLQQYHPASENSEARAIFLRDLLLWDWANWHKAVAVKALLANHSQLETLFFPPASRDLNPLEHVWSQARAAVSHNPHL